MTSDEPPATFQRVRPLTAAFRGLQDSVLARFASVGVVNTIVDFGLYVGLFALGMPAVGANFISTSAGMAVSFVGNRRFVFGASSSRAREITLFIVVCGLGIWGIQPAVIALATALLSRVGVESMLVVSTVPKVLAIGVAAVWNYLLYSRVVFRSGTLHRKERGEG